MIDGQDFLQLPDWSLAAALHHLLPWADYTEKLLLKYSGDAEDLIAVQEMLNQQDPLDMMPASKNSIVIAHAWCATLAIRLVIDKTHQLNSQRGELMATLLTLEEYDQLGDCMCG